VCQKFATNNTAKEVYGYVDSIKLAWSHLPVDVVETNHTSAAVIAAGVSSKGSAGVDALVMLMEGRPRCNVNPLEPTITKIYFVCAEKAEDPPPPTLFSESELGKFQSMR
jgi:hypothetical protein